MAKAINGTKHHFRGYKPHFYLVMLRTASQVDTNHTGNRESVSGYWPLTKTSVLIIPWVPPNVLFRL